MRSIKQIAKDTFKYFADLDGNQHIAREYALFRIIELIHKNEVKNVLEVGLGIGSISYAILDYAREYQREIHYYGTEHNDFCLNALPKYLKDYYQALNIYTEVKDLSDDLRFDFAIIDGPAAQLPKIKHMLSPNAIIFIEGYRGDQVDEVKRMFPSAKHAVVISTHKNPPYGPFPKEHWAGAGQLIFTNPTFLQSIQHVWEKLKTSLRYRVVRKVLS